MQGPYRSVVNENNAHVLHTERPVYVCHDDGIERDGDISHPGSVLTKAVLVEDSELRSCVKDEVDILGFPSLILHTVSVDLKQHGSYITV